MKFSCDKYVLQQAAASAARAAAPKSPIAALEGLLLEAGADLRITGYDLKKAIYTNMEADIPEPGSVLVGARLFCEMLRRMPTASSPSRPKTARSPSGAAARRSTSSA